MGHCGRPDSRRSGRKGVADPDHLGQRQVPRRLPCTASTSSPSAAQGSVAALVRLPIGTLRIPRWKAAVRRAALLSFGRKDLRLVVCFALFIAVSLHILCTFVAVSLQGCPPVCKQ